MPSRRRSKPSSKRVQGHRKPFFYEPTEQLKALLQEKRMADRLFFMAVRRRTLASDSLETYLKSLMPPMKPPVIQTELFEEVVS